MKKLIMMLGLPASGKSTWAKEYVSLNKGTVRINNDDMTTMLFGEPWAKGSSSEIESLRNHLILHYMGKKKDIIIDNTNLAPKHKIYYQKLVDENNANAQVEPACYVPYELVIKDFTNVAVAECVKRNRLRDNPVPDKVIYQMYEQYLKPEPVILTQDNGLPKAIVVDIDGTIARMTNRGPYDTSRYYDDEPILEVIAVVNVLKKVGNHVIFLTGREGNEAAKAVTIKWLKEKAGFEPGTYTLIMREVGDKTHDFDYKLLEFNKQIRDKYYVSAWFEDRIRNIEMARYKIGLVPVFQCGEGNF